jgi:hypothetical protein
MSIKNKVFAAAATLTLVGGVSAMGALTAGTASAATPSCGATCVDFFSAEFDNNGFPNFVLDTLRQGEKVGQPQILFRTSNTDPAEDYVMACQVPITVGPPATCSDPYPDLDAWEVEYAPYGVDSGLCAGVAATARANEKVTLQPCGESSKTVWIVDSEDSDINENTPLINGSDTNFSQPFVLTYGASAYPTDMPRPSLYVANLTGFQGANGLPVTGTIDDTQLWGQMTGVNP